MSEHIYFENKVKNVLDIYSQIELELLELIINKLQAVDGEIGGSLRWYLRRLNQLGGLNKETLKIISKYTGITQKELKTMFKTIGIDTIKSLNLEKAYKNGEITINPKVFYQDSVIAGIIEKTFKTTTKTFLDINENIVEGVNKKYVEILNTAYLETSSGVYDYGTSIRKAINKFADAGIPAATYKYEDGSTRTYNIEGIVRRDVLTASHQLSGEIIQDIVEETKPKYIYLSEHFMSRPTHAEWQGCYVETKDFESVTDYGDIEGIYGINCKHIHYPYYGDIDTTKFKNYNGYKLYTQDKKINTAKNSRNAKLYELSQEQRQLERNVRRWKRREIAEKDADEILKAKKKVEFWQHKLRNFTKDHPDLKRDYLREKI